MLLCLFLVWWWNLGSVSKFLLLVYCMIKISIKFNIGDKKTYYQEIIKDRKKKKRGYGNLFLRWILHCQQWDDDDIIIIVFFNTKLV